MDFTKLLNLKYLFTMEPAPFQPLQRNIMLVLLIAAVVGEIGSWLMRRRKREDAVQTTLFSKLVSLFLVMVISGWFLYFCRQQGVYLLSRRFWFAFWFVGGVLWLIFILKYVFVRAPKEKAEWNRREAFEKYLPKKKR
ncbi:hypothetical protein KKD19_06105 [Patescibacteria group bacterium]|nr:hypothetical protein [Patescibacteria group bacterium]MBU4512777.1 hypothetical protein [Patescibacteria group bacterium]MCG2692534.1 hypothetical protein [Candidatus Parcubacteria bacterium]